MMWTVETLNADVDAELEALPDDQRAKFIWISELIQTHGLHNVRGPYVKVLGKGLWEMRMKGRDGISRAIYVTEKPKRVIVLRVFVKKTQKTPRKEIKVSTKACGDDK